MDINTIEERRTSFHSPFSQMLPRIQSQNVTYLDTTKPHSINMYTFYSRGMGNRLSVGGAIGSEGGRMEERSAGAAGSGTRDAPLRVCIASLASHRARSRSRLYSADRVGRHKKSPHESNSVQ